MADDDQLRMQAVVVDGFTGPLKNLRDSLRNAGQVKTGQAMEKDWKSVGERVHGVTREINTALAPALRGIGISSLGVGAAVGGIFLGLKSSAQAGRNLKFFADQLRMSVKDLRELIALGQHFDIPEQATESALKAFANNMVMLKRHWGETYNALRAMNLGNLAEDLINAPTLKDAFEKALEDLRKIPDPVYRRQIAQMLLGSDQWSIVAASAQSDADT
ncbi:MAG TPA: hypothetical protein VFF05_02770, partial [Rudaea sp.]|nr:hypothetical protein [Rudaea sp.]